MSTIKSSSEHLTLNADGANKDIKFQANGVEKASISSAGAFTSTTIDATALTGTITNFTSTGIDDNADATAITIDSSENVSFGTTAILPDIDNVEGVAIATGSYDGRLGISRAGLGLAINRKTSDGELVQFKKDSTTVGSIGTFASDLTIGDADVGIRFDSGTGLVPWNMTTNSSTNGTIDIGASSARIKDLYLSGGAYIGGTGSANKLDDYEEGTFPITLTCDGNSQTQYGRYTKVGNLVTVTFGFDGTDANYWSIYGSTDDPVLITTNLPFTPKVNGGFVCPVIRSIRVSSTYTENANLVMGIGWRYNNPALYLGSGRNNKYYMENNAVKTNTQSNITISGSGSYQV